MGFRGRLGIFLLTFCSLLGQLAWIFGLFFDSFCSFCVSIVRQPSLGGGFLVHPRFCTVCVRCWVLSWGVVLVLCLFSVVLRFCCLPLYVCFVRHFMHCTYP